MVVVEVSVYEEGVMGEGRDDVIEDEVSWGNVVCVVTRDEQV